MLSNNISNDALKDINSNAEPKTKIKSQVVEILCNYLAKVFFSYLPLAVYAIVNIPYFTTPPQDDQQFLKGLFLALSYVFISQVSTINIKKDAVGNLLLAIKVFFGIVSIAFFVTDKFRIELYMFFSFCAISLFTLFFTHKNTYSQ